MTKDRARYDPNTRLLHYADGRIKDVSLQMDLEMEKAFGRRWKRDFRQGRITEDQITQALLKSKKEHSNDADVRTDAGGEAEADQR